MIEIEDKIISRAVFEEKFVCNLNACKGQCCIDGDSGAPLEDDELDIMNKIYPKVKKYLRPEGVASIKENGTYVKDSDGDWGTPLVNDTECAYVIFDENNFTKCGIEKAYEDGLVDFKKPISCHLYPIRVTKYSKFEALNYHEWDICSDACTLGKELNVKVYNFLKEPLIRKYGEEFYKNLQIVDGELNKS